MFKYVIGRLVQSVLVLVLIASITFLLMNFVPGGPFASEKAQSEEVLAAKMAKYGLDKPLSVQLKNYLWNAAHFEFGDSMKLQTGRPVIEIMREMFPYSAKIGLMALCVAVLLGVPLGCVAAYHRGKPVDSFLRVVTTLGISVPGFVLATIMLVIFAVKLKVLPATGLSSAKNYIMPVLSLSFYPMCYTARLSRSSMLDVINQDYIRTARAKGVSAPRIIFKHALRNAFIPVLTYLGPLTAGILTGSFVVESVFSIPGLGRYFVQSINNRDYPLIMATTIFFAFLVIVMNFAVDILYKFVDPRIDITKGVD